MNEFDTTTTTTKNVMIVFHRLYVMGNLNCQMFVCWQCLKLNFKVTFTENNPNTNKRQ